MLFPVGGNRDCRCQGQESRAVDSRKREKLLGGILYGISVCLGVYFPVPDQCLSIFQFLNNGSYAISVGTVRYINDK